MQKNVELFEKLTEAAKASGKGMAITGVEGTGYTKQSGRTVREFTT